MQPFCRSSICQHLHFYPTPLPSHPASIASSRLTSRLIAFPVLTSLSTMAPIQDASVDDLKHKVTTLEARIAELEQRLGGGQGISAQAQDSVRMILMGPPGAGERAIPCPANALVGERKC